MVMEVVTPSTYYERIARTLGNTVAAAREQATLQV